MASVQASVMVGEEQWQGAFDSLRGRFPAVNSERIALALRDHQGHAGYAARELRGLVSGSVPDADIDDKEHVAMLLSSPPVFKAFCRDQFQKFDENGNKKLEWEEIVALTGSLHHTLGLQEPSNDTLWAFFNRSDANQDGALSEKEFRKFFESFLQHAFFDTDKLRKIVADSSKSKVEQGGLESSRSKVKQGGC